MGYIRVLDLLLLRTLWANHLWVCFADGCDVFVLNLRVLPHVNCGIFYWTRFIHECCVIKVIARKYLFSAVTTGGKETEINQQLHSIRFVMFHSYLLLAHSFCCVCMCVFIFSSLACWAIHIHEQYSLVERASTLFSNHKQRNHTIHVYASTLICGAIRLSKLCKLNKIFCRIFFLLRIICCGLLARSLARSLNCSFVRSFVRWFVVVVVVRLAHHTHSKGIENHRKTSTLWETGWWRLCALILLHTMYTYIQHK